MGKTLLFKENILNAGIVKPNDIIQFEFELNEGIEGHQIDYIKPDCPVCTKIQLIGNKVKGSIDVAKAAYQYNKGRTPASKVMMVFLNDGRSEWIGKKDTKEMIANPEKLKERLNVVYIVLNE
ncbi:MAG: hypothetical protein J5I47_07690 [Vicingus serpentipes]|nr:hypothetical protein [Vicingus serpentipes]